MIRKLQRRFIAVAMASVILVLALLIGSINVLNYHSVISEADETLRMIADNGGSFPSERLDFAPDGEDAFFKAPPDEERGERPERRHGGFLWDKHERSAELPFQTRFFTVTFDSTGTVTAVNTDSIAALNAEEAETLAVSIYAAGHEKGFTDGYRYLRSQTADGTLLIVLSCERELSAARSFLLVSVLISAAGTALVFLLILLLSRRFVRPVAESYHKQKRFITDAGHELKTPLTIINADADVLETELTGRSEWLDDIRTQTARLSALTNDLIYLSRMEEDVPVQMIPFPLSDVVAETAQSFESLARVQNKTFTVEVQPMLSISGDEKAIRKLVSVLLDNAQKYSPEGGAIRLTLRREGKQVRLSVYNTATDIEKGSADRLFDRFYRTDASRNSGTGGFGLGLSVAKAVTEAHKGRIRAFSEDGASLLIEAVFPAA